ncbi:hypothetical protein EBU94_06195, partial [bacterium]|nr:hypothetical protein [bacterium]
MESCFFYANVYRNLSDFSGDIISFEYDEKSKDALALFMDYENGLLKGENVIKTKHPNILRSLVLGKKAWGLQANEWIDGIAQCLFLRSETIQSVGFNIPKSFTQDFENRLYKKRLS